jgi:hypothetical protein
MKQEQFIKHVLLWSLHSVNQSLQELARIQVDETISEDDKKKLNQSHQLMILSAAHMIKPYIDEAGKLFDKHTALFEWLKKQHDMALENKVAVACECMGCKEL